MTDIAKKVLSGTLRMARGTTTLLGLAVMLAVVLGVGTTALAAVPGDPFKLGKINAVDVASTLVGSVNGAMLGIENQSPGSKGASAPALSLKVAPNNPPLTANPEAGTATSLSADELDGKDSSAFLATGGKAADSDRLDGLDSNQLIRVASASKNGEVLAGNDGTALSTNIGAPQAGFLVIEASAQFAIFSDSEDSVGCLLRVDGTLNSPSMRSINLDDAGPTDGRSAPCPTNAVVPVGAGPHTVAFEGLGLETHTFLNKPAMSVLFVPFDAQGNPPAASGVASAEGPERNSKPDH